MAFTIPNEADAFNADQAEPDKVDIDILVAAYARTGVVSGCAVTAQGTPDMTVVVAAGTSMVAGVSATVSAGNVTITAADATNPRIDLIVINSSGTKSATAGTAAANPVMPAIPASSAVLAAVYVPANDTTIASNQITDKRVLITGRTLDALLGADVNVTPANTYIDGPSIVLPANTIWLVWARAYVESAANSTISYKLWDGTNVGATGAFLRPPNPQTVTLFAKRAVAGADETWKISVAATAVSATNIKAALTSNGAGNNATGIMALQVA